MSKNTEETYCHSLHSRFSAVSCRILVKRMREVGESHLLVKIVCCKAKTALSE